MKDINDKNKYLLKNTKIFAISNIATKLISFLLIPLYTHCLSTSEYGVIDLLFTISSVLLPLFTLNIAESIYRFSMDEENSKNSIFDIGFIIVFMCFIMSLIIIPVLNIFHQYSKYSIYVYFLINTSAIFTISSSNLKGQEKLVQYSVGNILNTLLIIVLNITFLKILNFGIEGYFLAFIISYVISSIYCICINYECININSLKLDYKLLKKMLKYSIVLIPNSFLWWIIDSSDRIMISHFDGIDANGLYAISYKIPAMLYAISGIFNQAWVFSSIKEKDSEDNYIYANKIFETLYYIMSLMAIFILTFIKPFFKLYLSNDYYDAWKFVPFLLVGSLFLTFSNFISASYNTYKDSKGLLLSSLYGSVINIILNFVFIPKFHAYGAAIATSICYIFVFIYRLLDTQKYLKIYFKIEYLIPICILIVMSFILYFDFMVGQVALIIILFISLFAYRNKIQIFFKKIINTSTKSI